MPVENPHHDPAHREADEERAALTRSIGIGEEYRPLRIVYNQASGILVASVERFTTDNFDRRIFFRHTVEGRYRPLGATEDGRQCDNVISSANLPVIYYTVWRVTPGREPGQLGGNWLSVERFDLAKQAGESVITPEGLKFPEPYAVGWVSQLISVAADDSVLYCSCGVERRETLKIHYWLCAIAPRTQNVTLLSRLEGIWF